MNKMLRDSIRGSLFGLLLLIVYSHAAIIGDSLNSFANNTDQTRSTAFFTIVTSLTDFSSQNSILSQLGVPGFSRKHGYNYIALDGWSCNQNLEQSSIFGKVPTPISMTLLQPTTVQLARSSSNFINQQELRSL